MQDVVALTPVARVRVQKDARRAEARAMRQQRESGPTPKCTAELDEARATLRALKGLEIAILSTGLTPRETDAQIEELDRELRPLRKIRLHPDVTAEQRRRLKDGEVELARLKRSLGKPKRAKVVRRVVQGGIPGLGKNR